MNSKNNLPNCPACSSSKTTFLAKHKEHLLLVCQNCGLRYSDPMKEPDEKFYQESYIYKHRIKDNDLAKELKQGSLYRDWRFKTATRDLLKKVKNPGNENVLDIGCGEGGFLYLLSKKGFPAFGIDIDPRAVKIANNSFGLKNVQVSNWKKYQSKIRFTFVTLFETLEHVSEPKELVQKVFEVLKNDGYFYLSVPSFERFPKLFDPEADFPPHHLTLWTKKALKIILDQAGFTNIKIIEKPLSGEDFQLHLIWFFKRQYSKASSKQMPSTTSEVKTVRIKVKKLLGFVSLKFFSFIALLIRLTGLARGHSYLVIAKKPNYEYRN